MDEDHFPSRAFHQKVLVHGGSGVVGQIALQIANYLGANVYSTGVGEKQLALIETGETM
ncbi:hypothetical protein [Algibacillus agarilyticus]|uniref:hypothetical protein n=1 Tax=Algibacillus agarilyticus TaxID=2234133 RepID=UPI003F6A170C